MSTSDRDNTSRDRVARDVLDSLLESCQVIGPDWKYLYVNDTIANDGRRSKEQLLGRTMMECYPGIDSTPMFSVLRRCMAERSHDRRSRSARTSSQRRYAKRSGLDFLHERALFSTHSSSARILSSRSPLSRKTSPKKRSYNGASALSGNVKG
jgi:hypothetical protein